MLAKNIYFAKIMLFPIPLFVTIMQARRETLVNI